MRLSILGCGYVGLVTGACLAEVGHHVMCADTDAHKIDVLRRGAIPIYEPGLESMVQRNVERGRLAFADDVGDAVRFGDAIFICVGTPPLQNGDADLSAIDCAARTIVAEARSSKLVVEKSTVPTQTGRNLARALAAYARSCRSQHSFTVVSNPEFLREGTAVSDFLHPDRIVVGVEDEQAESQMREIYRPIVEQGFGCPVHVGQCPANAPALLVTSISSSELIKHACNTFLAVKISYANLLADVCEKLGADVDQVVEAMGLDPRIGASFLRPGLGFGGFCLPKDIQAFIKVGERAGVDVSMLRSVEAINTGRIDHFVRAMQHALWILKRRRIAVLGLAFKPETDDVRFSPALELIRRLLAEGAEVQAYDPQAMSRARHEIPNVNYCQSAYAAAEGAEAVVIATEWEEFGELDWERVRDSMARPLLLDGRNLLDPAAMRDMGFEYHGIGRELRDADRSSFNAASANSIAGLRAIAS